MDDALHVLVNNMDALDALLGDASARISGPRAISIWRAPRRPRVPGCVRECVIRVSTQLIRWEFEVRCMMSCSIAIRFGAAAARNVGLYNQAPECIIAIVSSSSRPAAVQHYMF